MERDLQSASVLERRAPPLAMRKEAAKGLFSLVIKDRINDARLQRSRHKNQRIIANRIREDASLLMPYLIPGKQSVEILGPSLASRRILEECGIENKRDVIARIWFIRENRTLIDKKFHLHKGKIWRTQAIGLNQHGELMEYDSGDPDNNQPREITPATDEALVPFQQTPYDMNDGYGFASRYIEGWRKDLVSAANVPGLEFSPLRGGKASS